MRLLLAVPLHAPAQARYAQSKLIADGKGRLSWLGLAKGLRFDKPWLPCKFSRATFVRAGLTENPLKNSL